MPRAYTTLLALALCLLAGCPTGGEPAPGEAVVVNAKPFRFVTDGAEVYWLDLSLADQLTVYGTSIAAPPVDRIDLEGLALATAVTGDAAIAMDATRVYIGSPDGVGAFPRGGGSETAVITGSVAPRDLVIEGDTIFWVTEGLGETLFWAPLSGGPVTSVTLPDATFELEVDATYIYVRTYRGVYRVTRADQQVLQLADAADFEQEYADGAPMYSIGMVKNGDHLDWLVHQIGNFADQDRGLLVEIPLGTGAPRVVARDLLAPFLLAIDATGARYWSESSSAHAPEEGVPPQSIRRLPAGASAPSVLPSVVVETSPSDMAIASGALYWSVDGDTYDQGSIRRISLP